VICNPCRDGGKLNLGGFVTLAIAMHVQCKSPRTCPCQHKTGPGHIVTDIKAVPK
jgi:hypothetical protein